MKSISHSTLILAVWLSALAGYIDAIGFLYLAGYFVSFMSGNSTRFVVALQTGDTHAASILAGIIGVFVFGAMLGSIIGHYAGRNHRISVLGSVSLFLFVAAISNACRLPSLSIVFMVIAMGMENAIFQKDGNVTIGLTYMTGTLVKLGQKLAASLLGIEHHGWVPYAFLWLGLMIGGFVGAATYSYIGLDGLWFAAVASLCLTFIAIKHRPLIGE